MSVVEMEVVVVEEEEEEWWERKECGGSLTRREQQVEALRNATGLVFLGRQSEMSPGWKRQGGQICCLSPCVPLFGGEGPKTSSRARANF